MEHDLVEREQALRQTATGNAMTTWNHELAELSIESAELEARLQFVREKLEQIKQKNLLRLADEFADTMRRMNVWRQLADRHTKVLTRLIGIAFSHPDKLQRFSYPGPSISLADMLGEYEGIIQNHITEDSLFGYYISHDFLCSKNVFYFSYPNDFNLLRLFRQSFETLTNSSR